MAVTECRNITSHDALVTCEKDVMEGLEFRKMNHYS